MLLQPTLATKLQGDYRSGKRINMRKVIPYIASQFRKDKIWLRRTKPSKRTYQVMIAVDDSESVATANAGSLACEAMAMLCKALTRLEVGELSIASFGEAVKLLHSFDTPFTDDCGARVLSDFTFSQQSTDTLAMINAVGSILDEAKETVSKSSR